MIPAWEVSVNNAITYGPLQSTPTVSPLAPKHKGSVSYLEQVERKHPGFIRRLFRYAQKIRGALATFAELVDTVNQKSETEDLVISATRKQINIWFNEQGGKEFSPTTKPLDTP